jgi:hypothetical protein
MEFRDTDENGSSRCRVVAAMADDAWVRYINGLLLMEGFHHCTLALAPHLNNEL